MAEEDLDFVVHLGDYIYESGADAYRPPGGNVPHHVRWYLIKDGDKKLVGLLYAAREAAWKHVEAKFTASANSLKHAGN